jgi:hypothetical protein
MRRQMQEGKWTMRRREKMQGKGKTDTASPDLIAQAKSRVRYDRAISQGYRRDGCVLWVIGMESRVESA